MKVLNKRLPLHRLDLSSRVNGGLLGPLMNIICNKLLLSNASQDSIGSLKI